MRGPQGSTLLLSSCGKQQGYLAPASLKVLLGLFAGIVVLAMSQQLEQGNWVGLRLRQEPCQKLPQRISPRGVPGSEGPYSYEIP